MSPPVDLVVLVPGKNEEAAIGALLSSRHRSLGVRHIRYEILVHTRGDPGCFLEAPALVVFDRQGCGQEQQTVAALTDDLGKRLARAGWEDRAAVLVIEPELENWVWSDSPEVDSALGWQGRDPSLRDWLQQKGLWPEGAAKPRDPKEAVESALREVRRPRSSSIYRALAEQVSLRRCQDPSFAGLKTVLRSWFPPE